MQNLMYVKEDIILPHTITFYDLIINKAQVGWPVASGAASSRKDSCGSSPEQWRHVAAGWAAHDACARCTTSLPLPHTMHAGQVGPLVPV